MRVLLIQLVGFQIRLKCNVVHSKKNKVFLEPTKKGSVDVKSFQMSSNVERNNKKILPNLKRFFTSIQSRNLIKKTFLSFVQHLKRFRRKKEHTLEFRRENTESEGFVSSLFRCCTKLKKVFLIRFRDCIEVKNLFRFGRIFLLFLSTFDLIWKLLTSTEPFLVGSAKTLFFLECSHFPTHCFEIGLSAPFEYFEFNIGEFSRSISI